MEKYGEGEQKGKESIRIAFGSATSRLMIPEKPPPSRGGIEAGLRGAQNRGPGCYGPTPIELFLKELDTRPRSKRGVMFGASTGQRFANTRKERSPGPTTYQHAVVTPVQPAYKPFGSAAARVGGGIKQQQQPVDSPGPGHYQHDIGTNRHVEVMGSFGGTALLKEAVIIKCTNGIRDQCESCHCPMTGDYWERKINNKKSVILCHQCYEKQLQSTLPKYQNLHSFNKVRDCTSVHKHDGTQAQIQLKSDKEQKKLKYREAYLRLYYS